MLRTDVVSSNIKSIGYDPQSKTLEVEFRSGKVYQFAPVSTYVHLEIMSSDSIGRSFNALVKGDPDVIVTPIDEAVV